VSNWDIIKKGEKFLHDKGMVACEICGREATWALMTKKIQYCHNQPMFFSPETHNKLEKMGYFRARNWQAKRFERIVKKRELNENSRSFMARHML